MPPGASPRNATSAADLADTHTLRRDTPASPERVWAVLSDGWLFPTWVVGASRMRAVSAGWPAVGATLHHSVGLWPLVLDDTTSVLEADHGRRLLLEARTRPAGVHTVEIVLAPNAAGGTSVLMREDATGGPLTLAPLPVRQAGLTARNRETLHRLCLLAEARTHDRGE